MLQFNAEPQTIADIIWPSEYAKTIALSRLGYHNQRIALTGPPGLGKSVTAMALIKTMVPDITDADIVRQNCAEFRESDDLERSYIQLTLAPFNSKGHKVLLLEEVDDLKPTAATVFKSLIDNIDILVKTNKAKVPMILTTNNWHKVDGRIRSRFLQIKWDSLPHDQVLARAKAVLNQQGLNTFTDEQIKKLYIMAEADLRKFFELLAVPNIRDVI